MTRLEINGMLRTQSFLCICCTNCGMQCVAMCWILVIVLSLVNCRCFIRWNICFYMEQQTQGLSLWYYLSLVRYGSGRRWVVSASIWHSHDVYIMEKKRHSSLCNWLPLKLPSTSISTNSSPSANHQSSNDLSPGNGWRLLCCGWELSRPGLLFLFWPDHHTQAFRKAVKVDRSSSAFKSNQTKARDFQSWQKQSHKFVFSKIK